MGDRILDDRIEKLYSRWEQGDVDEDAIHVAIDELLFKARLIAPGAGDVISATEDDDTVHEKRIAILNTLCDLAGIEPEYTGPYHVVAYEVTREYGGPEEGGWYYDWYTSPRLVAKFPTEHDFALDLARKLNADAKEERRQGGQPQGRFSVLGGADVVYVVERTLGESTSTERPHYE